mgnify:CR=1 FL=1
MSVYTEISKEIDWEPPGQMQIPNEATIQKIIREAHKGDRNSFKMLFILNRFGVPQNAREISAINLAFDGFHATKKHFE